MNNPSPTSPEPRPGRPPALDPAKRQRVVALLAAGCSRRIAARYVGCSPSTITRTAARDPQFARQLVHAETNLEVELLGSIRNAAKTDRYWRAAAWILERKNPEDHALRPPHMYTPDQVIQLFTAALDTIHKQLPHPQRHEALQKLGSLLLEFDPPEQSTHHAPP